MNAKTFALRFIFLIVIAIAAGPVYAITVNAMVFFGIAPYDGTALTMQAVYVWLGCLLIGFGSMFIKDDWRLTLYLSPLYAPSLYILVFTIMQGSFTD